MSTMDPDRPAPDDEPDESDGPADELGPDQAPELGPDQAPELGPDRETSD
jgi:hypothetical protein